MKIQASNTKAFLGDQELGSGNLSISEQYNLEIFN